MNSDHVENQAAKIVSAWALIGITSWAEAASFAAFLYSALLILEWLWKRVFRPLAMARGWVKAKPNAAAE
jgi:hypothetical protein